MNFAFLALKTMRFYGWTWQELMRTPITAFWTCYRYIDRLAAQEALDQITAASVPYMDEQSRREQIEALRQRIGTVTVEKPIFDASGWRSLKQLA